MSNLARKTLGPSDGRHELKRIAERARPRTSAPAIGEPVETVRLQDMARNEPPAIPVAVIKPTSGTGMDELPSATVMADARAIVSTWDHGLTSIERLAHELVAIAIANLSRRRPDGWTERDLLTETTLPKHRFDRDLLRGGPLLERYFDVSKAEMEAVLAVAQYVILHRDDAGIESE